MEFTRLLLSKLQDSGKDICIFSNEASKLLYNYSDSDFSTFSKRSFYFWRENKRPIPLKISLKIMKDNGMNMLNIDYFSVYGGNKMKFLDDQNIAFSYLLGLILGDGCLCVQKKGPRKSTYLIKITFREEKEAKAIGKLTKNLFELNSSIYPGRGCYDLCIYSKPLVLILNKKYEIPLGKKYGLICVPKFIFRGDKNIKKAFLKGVFDSDGNLYYHKGKKAVQLRQKSDKFLGGLWKLFKELDLVFNFSYYDKANNSWVLWSSKKDLVDNFIKNIIDFKIEDDAPIAQPGLERLPSNN